MKLKIGVIRFPGSNCDQDIIGILRYFSNTVVQPLWYRDHSHQKLDLMILPGGFSYGDYLRAGAIASVSPIMRSLREHFQRGGAILGICNGFQILCEAGFLEGTLMRNRDLKHICRNVELRASPTNAFSCQLDAQRSYTIPISHSEGNYQATVDTVKFLEDNDQIVFRYRENPNGSVADIAAISDQKRQVLGMMPHPERAVDPLTGGTDGKLLLEAILSQCGKTTAAKQ